MLLLCVPLVGIGCSHKHLIEELPLAFGVKRARKAEIVLPLERVASLLWFAGFSVCVSLLAGLRRGCHQGGVVDRLFGAGQSHWAECRWAYVNIKAGTKDYRPLASGGSREEK